MSRAYFSRALGRLLITAAVVVVLTVAILQFESLPGIFGVTGVVASAILLIFAALAAVSLMLPPALLQLDERGFRALKKRVAGPARGDWDGITLVGTQDGEHGPMLVITHLGGKNTAVPLELLDATTADIEADVRRRLDAAHGYKRLS